MVKPGSWMWPPIVQMQPREEKEAAVDGLANKRFLSVVLVLTNVQVEQGKSFVFQFPVTFVDAISSSPRSCSVGQLGPTREQCRRRL